MESRRQYEENTGILTKSAINDSPRTSAYQTVRVRVFCFICPSLLCNGIISWYHKLW